MEAGLSQMRVYLHGVIYMTGLGLGLTAVSLSKILLGVLCRLLRVVQACCSAPRGSGLQSPFVKLEQSIFLCGLLSVNVKKYFKRLCSYGTASCH